MLKSILDRIHDQRILVLGGDHIDKEDLALHISVTLKALLSHRYLDSEGSHSISIYEYKRPQFINTDAIYSILRGEDKKSAIQIKESPRIFLFPNALPEDFDFDLNKIHEAAEHGNCYVILQTERSSKEWLLQQSSRWLDITKISYLPQSLAQSAKSYLSKLNLRFSNPHDLDAYISSQVENHLETLSQVKMLVRILGDVKNEIDETVVDAAISLAKKSDQHILNIQFKKWSERDRLLALGVSFFQNLPVDQLFAALEDVVERIWQKRDPSLRALDCNDLDDLSQYCHLSRSNYINSNSALRYVSGESNFTEIEVTRLVLNKASNSKHLYSIAWEMYRRQIVTALKRIAKIIKSSSDSNKTISNLELFGTQFEIQQLHEAVRHTFSEIGLISPSATDVVQNIIIELAADSSGEIRDFAARTVATWFESNPTQFWSTIHRIYEGAEFSAENSRISDSLGATTAVSLGYACELTYSGHLSENLINWLREVSENESFNIKLYFGYATLPTALARHFPQLRDFTRNLAKQEGDLEEDKGLADAIGWSLSKAYETYPVEVLDLLEELFQSWKQPIPKLDRREAIKIDNTKTRLANVLSVSLSEINFSDRSGDDLLRRIFNYVLELLRSNNKKTHKIAMKALCKQIENNFSVISSAIQEGVGNLSKNEKNEVSNSLVKVYLQERKELSTSHQGDVWFPKGDNLYRSWNKRTRPLTDVEEKLLLWLGDKKFPAAQQIATQAFIDFAREFDVDEEKYLRNIKSSEDKFTPYYQPRRTHMADKIPLGMSGLWAWLAIAPSALPEMIKDRIWAPEIVKQYQPIIRNILPQATSQSVVNTEAVQFVVNRWKNSPAKTLGNTKDSPELTALATFLRPGLWLANNPWAFFLVVGMILWGGHSITSAVIESIRVNVEKSRYSASSSDISSGSRSEKDIPSSPQVQPSPYTPTYSSPSNSFDSESFPKPTCGDPAPTSSSDYPVSFYPVYISYSETNLNRVRTQFCADSIKTVRKTKNEVSIQVSSFTSMTKAEEFRVFMSSRFGSSEVGEPRVVQKP